MATKPKHEQQENPHLKAAFLEIVANQLKANDPPRDQGDLQPAAGTGNL
jgi:hypothetical protein